MLVHPLVVDLDLMFVRPLGVDLDSVCHGTGMIFESEPRPLDHYIY